MAVPQELKPTGHRRLGQGMESIDDHRQNAAMPADDANANKTYFGPAGLLKGAGSGRNKTMLSLNKTPMQHISAVQKARRK
jgi:hypothetical protein